MVTLSTELHFDLRDILLLTSPSQVFSSVAVQIY